MIPTLRWISGAPARRNQRSLGPWLPHHHLAGLMRDRYGIRLRAV